MRTVLLAVGLIVVVCWGRSFGDVQPDLNENRKRKNVAVINRDSHHSTRAINPTLYLNFATSPKNLKITEPFHQKHAHSFLPTHLSYKQI